MTEVLRPFAVLMALLGLLGRDAAAAETESLDRIRGAAAAVALASSPAGAVASAADLDARLRLSACPEALAAKSTGRTASGFNVEVRCAAAGWKLNVPVQVRVQVPVMVAVRALDRGQTVTAADVELQMRDRAALGSAWAGAPEEVVGKVVARPVPAGAVLPSAALGSAKLVRRGQIVELIGTTGGFQVRASGKALADAAAGETLAVENASSRRVVQGFVRPDGAVEIRL